MRQEARQYSAFLVYIMFVTLMPSGIFPKHADRALEAIVAGSGFAQ